MKYSCPHCKAEWSIGESYHRAGQVFACTQCNKSSVIPLYCPTCCPKQVEEKQWLQTPSGHLGGRAFRCPKGHSFTLPVTQAEAHRRLAELGSEVGQYHQSTRIETLRDADTKKAVEGGYCSGACYDWIRRVLVSGAPKLTYRNFESSLPAAGALTGDLAAQHRQDHRAALMQVQGKSEERQQLLEAKESERKAGYTAWLDDRKRALSASESAAKEQYQRFFDARNARYAKEQGAAFEVYQKEFAQLNARKDIDFATKKQLAQQAEETYKASLATLGVDAKKDIDTAGAIMGQKVQQARSSYDADIASRKASLDASRAQPALQQIWAEYRRKMDIAIEKQRVAMGKMGLSARPFANLDLVTSSDCKSYMNGLDQLIEEVLNHPDFKSDCCVHMGINPPSGRTGHAVALHRQSTGGKYHLFDPNFGVYELTRDKTKEAFLFIFRTAYPNWAGGGTQDDQAYEMNGQTKGSYAIFRGNRVSAPAVVEERPPQSSARSAAPEQLKPAAQMPYIPVTAQQRTGGTVTGTGTQPGRGPAGPQPASGGAWKQVGGKWVK